VLEVRAVVRLGDERRAHLEQAALLIVWVVGGGGGAGLRKLGVSVFLRSRARGAARERAARARTAPAVTRPLIALNGCPYGLKHK
jgi:hypothetical protein